MQQLLFDLDSMNFEHFYIHSFGWDIRVYRVQNTPWSNILLGYCEKENEYAVFLKNQGTYKRVYNFNF